MNSTPVKHSSQIQNDTSVVCPLPFRDPDTIQLAHGAGGKMTAELIESVFLKHFNNLILNRLDDQAHLEIDAHQLAFTTDTFVVDPIFFPGGNIGELAINGTVNDLCMSGATPMYLSAGFVLEEGLGIEELRIIVEFMQAAANAAGVQIVTGDTKVVNKGSCDKLFINTTGIGVIQAGMQISAANLKVGDIVIVSGTIADHGMAVLTCREGLSFETEISSDTASLHDLVEKMLAACPEIHAMRDPTRGGLAATLNEFAKQSGVGIKIETDKIPVKPEVKAACEILGIDPLTVANEGKLIAVVPAAVAEQLLEAMRQHPLGREAQIIGAVVKAHPGLVIQKTPLGVEQILDMPLGHQLPRIC